MSRWGTWAALAALAACGGAVSGAPDGSADGGAETKTDSGTSDGGWTKCKAPSGVSVCGGPEQCGATCANCVDGHPGDVGLRICLSGPLSGGGTGDQCPDGALLAERTESLAPSPDVGFMGCVNEDLGKLYALNGRPDLVRYSDRGTYSGEPIPPPPATCPQVPGLNLCGGACGACPDPANQICMGRSPLHPYSLCVNKFGKVNTPTSCSMGNGNLCNYLGAGLKCLTFKVDAPSQSLADLNGMCVSPAICDAAAKGYPGGAFCTTGSP